jgi:HEAT repeat protein
MRLFILIGLMLTAAGCNSHSTEDWLAQLNDPDVVKRRQAIRELAARTAEPDGLIPPLIAALRDDSEYVRHDAAMALGKFGTEAREAVPALAAAIKDQAHTVRVAAAAALRKIDPAAAPQGRVR